MTRATIVIAVLLATGCTRYVDLSRGDAGSAKVDGSMQPDSPPPDADTGDAGQVDKDGGIGVDAAPHD